MVWVLNSRRRRWASHVTCMARAEKCAQNFSKKFNKIAPLEKLGIFVRIILKQILKK
jgi:hypothetical protein